MINVFIFTSTRRSYFIHHFTLDRALAKTIHDNSSRRNNIFKPINCAGLTETLLESELFGHVKGAFTDAVTNLKGLFEIADKGTLFLDEIGDMPLNMQAKLLRVIEDGIVAPVGSSKTVVVDVRIISATNHDIAKLMEEKKFREELYYRVNVFSIYLPPLRERKEDILVLAEYFLAGQAALYGEPQKVFSSDVKKLLLNYAWPGNVRELENCIERAVVLCDTDVIERKHLPPSVVSASYGAAGKQYDWGATQEHVRNIATTIEARSKSYRNFIDAFAVLVRVADLNNPEALQDVQKCVLAMVDFLKKNPRKAQRDHSVKRLVGLMGNYRELPDWIKNIGASQTTWDAIYEKGKDTTLAWSEGQGRRQARCGDESLLLRFKRILKALEPSK